MKEKGFTLVELLVVMVILGIITAISFPLVRNIRENSSEREYSTYQNSVKYAAKLYVNAYENDLFGHEDSGCIILTYETLKARNLLKDIELRGVSCATEDTYVRVVKMNGKYGYSVHLGCGKKNDSGEVVVNYRLPKEEVVSNDTCGMDAATIMNISVKVKEPESIQYKKRTMNVLISSSTGVNSDPIIQYGFSLQSTPEQIDNWQRLVIDPESVSNQLTKIEKGETIQVISSQIETPDLLTGQYYLILRVDRLQDISGKNWSNNASDEYVYFGPFTLDNTPPVFQDSTITSSASGYNNLKPKLQLNVVDDTTLTDQLKMCISYDTDSCLKTKKDLSDYENYDSNKILEEEIHNSLDGSSHKVFVTVVDEAGNFTTKEFTYELAFTITYDGNGNTGGSTANTYCNKNVDCPLRENGFEKLGYTFDAWYNQKTGGNKYGTFTILTENINVYAQWDTDENVWNFDYVGKVVQLPIPRTGYYQLEVWGAQGGTDGLGLPAGGGDGGKGGYAIGKVYLEKDEILYIAVGGRGKSDVTNSGGGWNGGGNAGPVGSSGGGGGATHIAKKPGKLASLSKDRDSILIVAGGGGGAGCNSPGDGGDGGGKNGKSVGNAKGGTQSDGGNGSYSGSFGAGGNRFLDGGGGGGGYFGGGAAEYDQGAGGGSGYIGHVEDGKMKSGVKKGNGYAIVTFLP